MWSTEDDAFYWVDIRGKNIHRWKPASGALDCWDTPSFAGCIAPRRKGGLIVGLQDCIATFAPHTGAFSHFAALPGLTGEQRLNDGKCDPQGRFWVGSMNIVTREPDGMLYCLETDGSVRVVLTGLAVPNSLCWSLSGDTLYFSQTRDRKILAYPFDAASGTLGTARTVREVAEPGTPDGATIDAEDRLWFAEYGNSRLTRLSSDGRSAIAVDLPCRFPTSCCFGGRDFKTLLVTSASTPVSGQAEADRPHEGLTYALDLDCQGRAPDAYLG
jgi:L-arabinonolactonase